MEKDTNSFAPPHFPGERKQPLALIAQLMQDTANMKNVDEVFLWLSAAFTQSLNIPAVQFFAAQVDNRGTLRAEVRAMACQNPFLPQSVFVNNQVTATIERLLLEQRTTISLPVEHSFSQIQVPLFTQYDLRFWTGYFIHDDALLLPAKAELASEKISTALTMIVSFFSQLPLSAEQGRAIKFILAQAMRIIVSRKFLSTYIPVPATTPKNGYDSISLSSIVPRRAQNIAQFQADNPFTSASIIADKLARRLYSAIDGHKNVSELAHIAHLDQKEASEALEYLVQQQKIQLYTLQGEPIQQFL